MEQFFIDVIDGDVRHEDEVGERATLEQVKVDAALTLLDLFRLDLAGIENRKASAIVRNGDGRVVYAASLSFCTQREL